MTDLAVKYKRTFTNLDFKVLAHLMPADLEVVERQ